MLINLKIVIKNLTKKYLLSLIVGGVVCVFLLNSAAWLYVNFRNNYLSFFAPGFIILSIIIPFIKDDIRIEERIRKFVFWNVAITAVTFSILWFFELVNSVSPGQPPRSLVEEITTFFGVAIIMQLSVIPSIMVYHRIKNWL